MNLLFNQGLDRKNTNSLKWDLMSVRYPYTTNETLPFWVADMDLPTCPEIIQAIQKRVSHPAFGYEYHQTEAYCQALMQWFKQRFDWQINASDIVHTPGIVNAIAIAIQTYTKESEGVIIQQPVYYPFMDMITLNKRSIVNNALIAKQGKYTIDFDDLEKKAKDPNNKLFLFCSPHNPVGRVWNEEELALVARICADNNVLLFSDEIHMDLIRKGHTHLPMTKVAPDYIDTIIVATAPSKTFNIPGLQMSNIIIRNKLLRDQFKHSLAALAMWGGNTLGGIATEAAYTYGEEWLNSLNTYLDDNFTLLKDYAKEHLPKAYVYPCEGTYLAWIDFSAYQIPHDTLNTLLLKEGQVILSNGKTFGEIEGENHFRMNFGCSATQLTEGLYRIAKAIRNVSTPPKNL